MVLSDSMKDKIQHLWLLGYSQGDIAKILNYEYQDVLYLVSALGLHDLCLTEEQKKDMEKLLIELNNKYDNLKSCRCREEREIEARVQNLLYMLGRRASNCRKTALGKMRGFKSILVK